MIGDPRQSGRSGNMKGAAVKGHGKEDRIGKGT